MAACVGCAVAPTPTLTLLTPTALMRSTRVPFEIIATDAPFVGKGSTPILFALRGDDPTPTIPDELPEKAKEILRGILAIPTPDLFIVMYAGWAGSTGYDVLINSVTMRQDAGVERLVIQYSVTQPSPNKAHATVMTHPFAILRVSNSNVHPSAVVFERQ